MQVPFLLLYPYRLIKLYLYTVSIQEYNKGNVVFTAEWNGYAGCIDAEHEIINSSVMLDTYLNRIIPPVLSITERILR